jgi:hypothetical protein
VVSRGHSRLQLLKASLLAALTVAALGALGPAAASAETVVSCPFDPTGAAANDINRGFYVTNYSGSNIDQVTLEYGANASAIGSQTITLTARSGTYDGPIIGTRTASLSLPNAMATVPATFAFGGAPVTPGSTVAFTQTRSGGGTVFYNLGVGPCAGVTQTNGTTPPLDTPVHDHVGVTITQVAAATPTGQRAAALKKCKKKHSHKKRRKCRKRANRLPV